MKRLPSLLLLLMALVVLSGTFAMAANDEIFPITITDNSSTDRTNFPVLLSFNGTSLVNAGFVAANATDTNMQLGSTNVPFLMGTTQVPIFVENLPSDEQITYKLLTGYSPEQDDFDIIVGTGGHITFNDHADLELGDNATISVPVFFSSVNGTFLHKPSAFSINFTDANTINATVAGDASVLATGLTEALHTVVVGLTPAASNTTLTLRPNAAGDETNIVNQTPASDEHWDKVDEVVADDGTTLVWTSTDWQRDLYNIADSTSEADNITNVTVWARCMASISPTNESLKIAIKSGTGSGAPDTVTESATMNLTASYANYSNSWATNPATSSAWSWAEIDNLQAGISLRDPRFALGYNSRCTQVWVEVEYGFSSATLAIYIDDVIADSTALTANVTDNAQNWVFMDDDTAPYSDNLSITVDGTQVLLFEPNEMITTTTLSDRAGTAQNGTITWGSNTDILFSYGEVDEDADVALTPDAATIGFDAPALEMPDEWYATTSKIGNLPFYTTLNQVSTDTGIPLHTIYIGILVSIALAFGVFFAVAFKSAIPAVIIIGGILIMGADATIIPIWAIFTFLVATAGILYAARAAN